MPALCAWLPGQLELHYGGMARGCRVGRLLDVFEDSDLRDLHVGLVLFASSAWAKDSEASQCCIPRSSGIGEDPWMMRCGAGTHSIQRRRRFLRRCVQFPAPGSLAEDARFGGQTADRI